MSPNAETTLHSRRGKVFRALAWAGLLLLMAWVPSCNKTGENSDSGRPVVAAEGDPIDGVVNSRAISPSLPQFLAQPSSNTSSGTVPAGVDLKSSTPTTESGVLPVTFAHLSSYEYNVPDSSVVKTMQEADIKKLSDQIPDTIKKLNKKRVAVSGFMVPIDMVDEGVKSFILTYSQMMCCFGQMPWYNEWVFVEMPEGEPAAYEMDVPITVMGQLEVGEEIEDGFVVSLYRMKGEKVTVSGEPVGKATR